MKVQKLKDLIWTWAESCLNSFSLLLLFCSYSNTTLVKTGARVLASLLCMLNHSFFTGEINTTRQPWYNRDRERTESLASDAKTWARVSKMKIRLRRWSPSLIEIVQWSSDIFFLCLVRDGQQQQQQQKKITCFLSSPLVGAWPRSIIKTYTVYTRKWAREERKKCYFFAARILLMIISCSPAYRICSVWHMPN